MIKQFVPQDVCLKCQGCCRFKKADSVWTPCLLDEEIQNLVDKADIPPALLSLDRRIRPIDNPQGEGFICAFLDIQHNKCKIYELRPFECQLYPFLISMRHKKILLTLDLNCPYVKDKLDTQEFKDYTSYLSALLNSPKQLEVFKDNPQIIQAYEEVLDVMELEIPDEIQ
jgi:Fe-S-cluster containining protein